LIDQHGRRQFLANRPIRTAKNLISDLPERLSSKIVKFMGSVQNFFDDVIERALKGKPGSLIVGAILAKENYWPEKVPDAITVM
jgi:hypothetical protein